MRVGFDAWEEGVSRVDLEIQGDFDFESLAYRELFASSTGTAFQHPAWLASLYGKLLVKLDVEPVILTGCKSDGQLIMVLPMALRSRFGIRLLEFADFGISDYNAPVLSRSLSTDEPVLAEIRRLLPERLPKYDLLRIAKVRSEHVPLFGKLLEGSWIRHSFSAHETEKNIEHENWRQKAVSASFRKTLDRKKRRLFRDGKARMRKIVDANEISAALERLADLREGRFEGDLIQNEDFREFYKSVAASNPGFAEVHVLEYADQPVGLVFGVVHNDTFCYLQIGCDYKNFGKHSPGYILYDEIYRDFIERGGRVFDFTVGDEPFKEKFGTKPVSMFQLLRARTLPGLLAKWTLMVKEKMKTPHAA